MRFLPVLTSVAVTIGLAAPAYADDNDQQFLAELRRAGISYEDPDRAIAAARSVCELVEAGMSGADIVGELRTRNPAFQGIGAAEFTTLAAAHYCPKYITGQG